MCDKRYAPLFTYAKKNYPKDCGETKSRRYNNVKAYFYKTVQSRTNKTAEALTVYNFFNSRVKL